MSNDPHVDPVDAAAVLVEGVDAPAAGAIPSISRRRHPLRCVATHIASAAGLPSSPEVIACAIVAAERS